MLNTRYSSWFLRYFTYRCVQKRPWRDLCRCVTDLLHLGLTAVQVRALVQVVYHVYHGQFKVDLLAPEAQTTTHVNFFFEKNSSKRVPPGGKRGGDETPSFKNKSSRLITCSSPPGWATRTFDFLSQILTILKLSGVLTNVSWPHIRNICCTYCFVNNTTRHFDRIVFATQD